MSKAPMWRRYLRLFGPDVEGDVEDELEFHLEMRIEEYVSRGMDAKKARELALRRFGDLDAVRAACVQVDREVLRRRRRVDALAAMAQDARYAGRSLRKNPGFAAVAVLTIALGVGATTSIFSLLNGVLLDPLPYAGADRLVVPQSQSLETGYMWNISFGDYRDWRAAGVFGQVAAYRPFGATLAGEGEPERVSAVRVTQDYFAVLGAAPVLGRTFRPEDLEADAAMSVILSYKLWQRRFGGARDVVGKTLRIEGAPVEVVGVMSRDMEFPPDAELWVPQALTPANRADFERRDNYIFAAIARLAPGKSLRQTQAELATLARRVEQDNPVTRKGVTITVVPLASWIVGETLSRALWVFLGAVALVLLIACVNVANLLMSRAAAHSRELAVRSALGAGRLRLARQLLTECLVLALIGGAFGVLLAYAGVRGLLALAPADIPRLENVAVDGTVLAFAVGVSVLCAVLFGLMPSLRASAERHPGALGETSGRTTSGVRGRRARDLLVAGELALSLVLLIGAGLLLRSFAHLSDTDPGFRAENLLTFELSLQGERYSDVDFRVSRYAELPGRLEALPGVQRASVVSALPLGGGGFYLGRAFLGEGQPEPPASDEIRAMWSVVGPGYFGAMGIPLLQGRDIDSTDRSSSVPVMIVNREFARQMFPDGDVLGKRVRSWRDENVYREIIGVVDDVRYFGAGDEIRPLVYVPHAQDPWRSMAVVVRTTGEPGELSRSARRVIGEIDPELALARLQTMDEIWSASVAPQRFGAVLISAFAGVALLLAVIGIYGVLSYLVAQRNREIGVRMALGARPARVLWMVIREASSVVGTGIALGLLCAYLFTRAMLPLLFEVSTTDPLVFAGVPVILAAVALAASWLPARRATRVDPLVAIRAE